MSEYSCVFVCEIYDGSIFTRRSVKNIEFDFMDDVSTTPTSTMRVRAQNSALKGSAKKKTANFASVIDAMKKNKRTTGPAGTPTSSAKD